MKIVKSMLVTIVCALVILALGYGGILLSGEQVLKSPTEPEAVTMTGSISHLFYSRLEDDVSLYPWNYYPEEQAAEVSLDQKEKFYARYGGELEQNVLYPLISIAADVDQEEVSAWYEDKGQTIIGGMKQGVGQDGSAVELYFYDDVVSLSGMQYQVKIACNSLMLLSFSCIPCWDDAVKDTEEWNEKKELFRESIAKNPEYMLVAYEYMAAGYKEISGSPLAWYMYVDMYACDRDMVRETLKKQALLQDIAATENGSVSDSGNVAEYSYKTQIATSDDWIRLGEIPVQMIELKDCVILVMGSDFTVGLYYDVIGQRVVGFHYFGG